MLTNCSIRIFVNPLEINGKNVFRGYAMFPSVGKGGNASDAAAKDESVDVMSALVRVHRLQVHHVPDHVVLVADAVAAEHVPALPGDGEGLAAVVPLEEGDHLGDHLALLLEPAQLEARVQAEGDLSHGVGQLLLDQLVAG